MKIKHWNLEYVRDMNESIGKTVALTYVLVRNLCEMCCTVFGTSLFQIGTLIVEVIITPFLYTF